MLKHASPQRSASSLANPLQGSPATSRPSHGHPDLPTVTMVSVTASRSADAALRDSYSERSVDCESLIVPSCYALAEKEAGYQVGTWSGVSQASVRRGLSFSSRRAPDAISFRSVRSEGPPASHVNSSPALLPKTSTSCSNVMTVSTLQDDSRGEKVELSDEKDVIQCSKSDMSSLKNLLRLPGVRGHAKIVEVSKAGVVLNPDSLSLNSSDSFFSANSGRTSSRSWSSNASSNSNATNASTGSNSSTSEPASTTIKIFAKCLRSDIEYKTISVSSRATCKEVVNLLLSKYRMRHRDPNLFYLTMEVTVRRWSGMPLRSLLVLEDGARPAQLALCRPPGDSRFALQMRRGGVIKVHDTVLMPGSQYKSLLVSDRTTAEEVVQLLLNCYDRRENKHYYAIHEVRRSPNYNDRILLPDEKPLEVKSKWPRDRQAEFVFVLRRNMSQALSLRRLSLRNGEVKRPQVSAEVSDCGKTPPSTETLPVKGILKTSLPKPAIVTDILLDEEAVIDCTGVTPKMTTISRKVVPVNVNKCNPQLNGSKTSSLHPVATISNSSGPTVKFSNVVSTGKCSDFDATSPDSKFHGITELDCKESPASSLSTVDSSTNTEIKSWSNISTQTIVSSTVRKPPAQVHSLKESRTEESKDFIAAKGDMNKLNSIESVCDPHSSKPAINNGHEHMCKHNCNHCFYI